MESRTKSRELGQGHPEAFLTVSFKRNARAHRRKAIFQGHTPKDLRSGPSLLKDTPPTNALPHPQNQDFIDNNGAVGNTHHVQAQQDFRELMLKNLAYSIQLPESAAAAGGIQVQVTLWSPQEHSH